MDYSTLELSRNNVTSNDNQNSLHLSEATQRNQYEVYNTFIIT